MLEALASDAVKDPALEVTALVEEGRPIDLPARVRRLAGGDVAGLVAAACVADWAIIVAPETDGILAALVKAVREAGGHVLAPVDRVIEGAADKQATVDTLAARGIPVPAGRALSAGELVPAGFRLPAVRKARTGCGGDGLEVLSTRDASPAARPTRLEAFTSGAPVGVSCICGTHAPVALPPMRQIFTAGVTPRYLGSDPLTDAGLAARATALALRAATALAADAGWVGVDLILGDRSDGRDDRVLEVNPRITTSFVGLARLYASSLVAAMIDAAVGDEPKIVPSPPPPGTGSFRLPAD